MHYLCTLYGDIPIVKAKGFALHMTRQKIRQIVNFLKCIAIVRTYGYNIRERYRHLQERGVSHGKNS